MILAIRRLMVTRLATVASLIALCVLTACSFHIRNPHFRIADLRNVSWARSEPDPWHGYALVVEFASEEDLTSPKAALSTQARCYLDDQSDETTCWIGRLVGPRVLGQHATVSVDERRFAMYFALADSREDVWLTPRFLRDADYQQLRFHVVRVGMLSPSDSWTRSNAFVLSKLEMVELLNDAGIAR